MFTQGYIIDLAICLAALWLLYVSLLAERIPDRAARFYLLLAIPVSLLIPALKLPLLPPAPAPQSIEVSFISDTALYGEDGTRINYLLLVYFVGAALMLARMFADILKLALLVRKADGVEHIGGMKIIYTAQRIPTYSFFDYIFVNREYADSDAMESIIAHERHHYRLGHTADLIFICLLRSLLWFNPMAWHIVAMLRQVHEYEADGHVIGDGYSTKRYIDLIIKSEAGISPEFTSPLSYSLTKKRLKMITENKRACGRKRLLLTIPVTALMMCAFSLTARAERPSEPSDAPEALQPELLSALEATALSAEPPAVQQQEPARTIQGSVQRQETQNNANRPSSPRQLITPNPSDQERLAQNIAKMIEESANRPHETAIRSGTVFIAYLFEPQEGEPTYMLRSCASMQEAEAYLKQSQVTKTASYPLDENKTILFVLE